MDINKMSNKKLPFFHSTKSKYLEDIINAGIIPRYCDVLEKDLTYLFYGRASFSKSNNGQIKVSDSQLLAISFGVYFDSLNDNDANLIIPFDTGACKNNLFLPHIEYRDDTFQKYSIQKKENIHNHINKFFLNDMNYILGKASRVDNSDEYLCALNNLLLDTSSDQFDERARTIEYSTKQSISINAIECLVIHDRDAKKPAVKKIEELYPNIKIIQYYTPEVIQERSTYDLVKSKVMEYIISTMEVRK